MIRTGGAALQTSVLPKMDMSETTTGCCPKFNPEGWEGRHLVFEDKPFLRATTRSLLHVPINMGKVFGRVQKHIEEAGAQDEDSFLILSRDLSATEAEHYFAVTRDVPGEEMVALSGTFVTRVFGGPYRHAKDWVNDMEVAASAAGKTAQRVFLFYTTCPACARAYGRNYVVGLAQID